MGTPITTSQDGPSFASNLVDNQGSCYSNVSPLSSTFTKDCDENRIRSDNHYGQKEREESSSSEISSLCQSNAEGSDMEHLQSANPIHNLQSFEPSGHRHEQPFPCKTRRMPGVGRRDCLSIWILVSSFYSTGSSLLWMMLAVTKCQYETLGLPGHMSSHTATVFCTAISKTIELTFATVFVTFLGQVLSVRALGTDQSISIAEMSMRGWITQPGTLFTHLGSSLQVAFTRLGGFAFLAAVTAMLYTTASDSLVAPKLNSGKNQDLLLRGRVTTSFANTTHVMAQCTTPISNATDNQTFQTCIQLQHAGQAYHNYIQYLGSWQEEIQNGRVSKDQSQRPRAVGVNFPPSIYPHRLILIFVDVE